MMFENLELTNLSIKLHEIDNKSNSPHFAARDAQIESTFQLQKLLHAVAFVYVGHISFQ